MFCWENLCLTFSEPSLCLGDLDLDLDEFFFYLSTPSIQYLL